MEVKNVMEQIVFDCIDKNIKILNCCDCPQCRMDIAACVLNRLPPRYVTTETGELYTRVSQMGEEFKTEVMVEVIRAAEAVRNFPKHPVGQSIPGDSRTSPARSESAQKAVLR